MPAQHRPSVWKRASSDTSAAVRDRPVRTGLATGAVATPPAVAGLLASDLDMPRGWQIVLSIVASGLGAFLLVLLLLFVAMFITARRHQLEDRVDALETTVQEQAAQLVVLTQAELGDRDRFIPTYQDLRANLRDAKGKVEGALETGQLWGLAENLSATVWKRKQDDLRDHPYAREDDVYGVCVEAFTHVERLSQATVFRWKNRGVKETDNLGDALAAIDVAIARLDSCIAKAKPAQP